MKGCGAESAADRVSPALTDMLGGHTQQPAAVPPPTPVWQSSYSGAPTQSPSSNLAWRRLLSHSPASCRGTLVGWCWLWSTVGIPRPLGAPRETPSAGRGRPAPWQWDPAVASMAPSAACRPHLNLASLIPDVMAVARVEKERGLPMA